MIQKPRLNYCGLTVVMNNPSRFDNLDLLTANGGFFINDLCLYPDYNKYQCEIRTKDETSPLLPTTKCVLLLGEGAAKQWLGNEINEHNHLGEIRGSVYSIGGVPHIASYLPQDCVDLKDYEREHNPLSEHFEDSGYDNDDDEDGDEKRRHGKTSRKNYGFWLMKDIDKVKHILQYGVPDEVTCEFIIYPPLKDIIELLTKTKDSFFYIDIETDADLNIICFSFAFDTKRVFVVPCLLPDYSHAYSGLGTIYRALAICFRDNITVAHNGHNFDFFVFAYKYRIAIGKRVYDTMIAQHRCFPEQEKSLGHCTSLWTWQRFHKDMGDVPYNNLTNANKMWRYCGYDTFTMALVREAIDQYAKSRPGLTDSIAQGNAAIRPYLTATIMGIRYNQEACNEIIVENDKLCNQYLRMLDILIGTENLKEIRGKGKSSLPMSPPQCVKYFHGMLGYDEVGKGKERKDGTRQASLGKKNLFKLALKYENPVIDIIIAYRETMKETAKLQFTPFRLI